MAPPPPAPTTGPATDAVAEASAVFHAPQSVPTARLVGAGGISALFSAVERVGRQEDAQIRAPGAGDEGNSSQQAGSASRMQEAHFEPHWPEDGDGTKLNASGFVDSVIPRRRGNEKKVKSPTPKPKPRKLNRRKVAPLRRGNEKKVPADGAATLYSTLIASLLTHRGKIRDILRLSFLAQPRRLPSHRL